MHLNPQHPNILADMQAAANGRDLRDGERITTGLGIMVAVSAKRHLIPRKSYPYASERQVKRQRRRRHLAQGMEFGFIPKAETGA